MKPLGGKSYGSIPHLIGSKLGEGDHHIHEGQHRILTNKKRDRHDVVFVTEKYDGSNVSIANVGGKIIALTRSGYEADTSPYKTHHAFNFWVKKHKSELRLILPEDTRLCCEWLHKRHSLEYFFAKGTAESFIVCFDLIDNITNEKMPYFDFYSIDTWLIPKARIIHIGEAIEPNKLLHKLNGAHQSPVRCVQNPEGMVYRCERHGKCDFLAKWVRSDFMPGEFLTKKNFEL